MKKILVAGLFALVLVVGIAIYTLLSRLDTIVADAIEAYGSEIVGTPVRVGAVDLDLREGRGTIRDVRIANPEGFSGEDALHLAEIALSLDVASLGAEPVVIDDLTVRGARGRFEVDARGRSNVQELRSRIDAYSAADARAAREEAPAAAEEARRLRIRRFVFEEGSIVADVRAVDADRTPYDTELPGLRLQDVGGAAGEPPGRVGQTVLAALTRQILRTAAASQAQREVEERLGGGEAGKAAGKLLRRALE